MFKYLESTYIWLMCILYTLKISINIIFYSYIYKQKKLRYQGDRILKKWAKSLLKIVKAKYTIHDKAKLLNLDKNRNYIIMSNHSSIYDIPLALLTVKGSVRMLTKSTLFKIPIWGKALSLSEFLPIDRLNSRNIIKQLNYAKQKMQSGIILWIAPEGTRSKKNTSIKKGGFLLAKKTEAIIITLRIENAHKVHKAKSFLFNTKQKIDVYVKNFIDSNDYKGNTKGLINAVTDEIHHSH